MRTPVFLIRETERRGRTILTLHTADPRAASLLRRDGAATLRAEGIDAVCRVVLHRPASLRRSKSLEALDRRFGSGRIVYDPTRMVGRSEAILDCGRRMREALAGRVGLYVDAGRRTLFVIVDRSGFPAEPKAMLAERAATLKKVTATFRRWQVERAPDFDLAVRVGFEVPAEGRLVPVDSLTDTRRPAASVFRAFRRGAVATLLGSGMAAPAAAADFTMVEPLPTPVIEAVREPAVAAPNFGIQTRGAWLDGDGLDDGWAALGFKGTIPLGQLFGFQLDGAIGTDEYYGVGGHLFWRDPSVGLVGAIASYESLDEAELARVGAEAELYVDRITVGGRVGYQSGDIDESVFGRLDISFYATPNFAIRGGGEFSEERNLGRVGLEWQPAFIGIAGLSVYADAEFGDDDYTRIMAGLNFHFGTNGASLIDRDRKYDPGSLLYNLIPHDFGYGGGGGGMSPPPPPVQDPL